MTGARALEWGLVCLLAATLALLFSLYMDPLLGTYLSDWELC